MRVGLAANEAARSQARDRLSHGRSIERNTLAKRALVEVRLAVQRIQRGELGRRDRVRYLFIPQQVHRLHGATQQMARMLHQVLGRGLRVRRFSLHPSSPQLANRPAADAAPTPPPPGPKYLAEA